MEMGPLLQAIADGDTVAFVYEMYLTPKGMENAPTFTMMATEFNHFKVVGEKLIVTRLDLYTDGGKMNGLVRRSPVTIVRSDRTKQNPRIFLSRWTLKRFWGLCNVFQRLLNNSLDFRTYKVSKAIDNIDKVMGQIRLDILHRSIHDSLTAFFRSP